MKRTLLLTLFICLFAFVVSAQKTTCGDCDNGQQYDNKKPAQEQVKVTKPNKKKKISVYPNPAVDFIGLSEEKDVKKITLLNVMGRSVKTFQVEKGMKYNVSNLKRGMYLVQLVGYDNKIITTQRLNKR